MTRGEHIAWCKSRALAYVDAGDLSNAVGSMASDMTKHEETQAAIEMLGLIGLSAALAGDRDGVRQWIVGFG